VHGHAHLPCKARACARARARARGYRREAGVLVQEPLKPGLEQYSRRIVGAGLELVGVGQGVVRAVHQVTRVQGRRNWVMNISGAWA